MANFTALKTAINNAIRTNGNEEITGAILQAILDAMVETLGDSAINDLEDAIAAEVTNRENAVGGVADDLAAEVQARQALDYNVNNRINAEEYNRQNADAALSQTMSQGFQTLGSQMNALNAAISALNAAYQNGFLYGGIATPSSSPSNGKCFYIALQGGTYTNFGGVGVVEGINIIKNDSGWKVEHIYDQTTLLNEFYLLRQQVIQAITSFAPIVIEGDVTNAPDEEDLTSNANHLLQFKNNAYSPLEFSGMGRKYLRKNIAPLSESAPFNGFVEGVTAEETLSGTPTQIFWDRMNTRFVGIKDGVYYLDWTGSDNYVPVSTSLVYMYNGTPYQWTGSDFIVDETEVPNLVNCLTQDMINEANTIYIIRYDYTLKEDITIPEGCVLQFDGGSISGEHTITGANTGIEAGLVKIFSTNVTLAGTWNVAEAYPEWFGAKGDGVTDCTDAIQKSIFFHKVSFKADSVYCSKLITINIDCEFIGHSALKHIDPSVASGLIKVDNNANFTAFDITFDGNKENISWPVSSYINLVWCCYGSMHLERCVVKDTKGHAVRTGNVDDFNASYFAHNVVIRNCKIIQSTVANSCGDSLRVERTKGVTLDGNTIIGGLSGARCQLYCSDLKIENNIVASSWADVGITAAMSENVLIQNNECYGHFAHGIEVDAVCDAVIKNNFVHDNEKSGIFCTSYNTGGNSAAWARGVISEKYANEGYGYQDYGADPLPNYNTIISHNISKDNKNSDVLLGQDGLVYTNNYINNPDMAENYIGQIYVSGATINKTRCIITYNSIVTNGGLAVALSNYQFDCIAFGNKYDSDKFSNAPCIGECNANDDPYLAKYESRPVFYDEAIDDTDGLKRTYISIIGAAMPFSIFKFKKGGYKILKLVLRINVEDDSVESYKVTVQAIVPGSNNVWKATLKNANIDVTKEYQEYYFIVNFGDETECYIQIQPNVTNYAQHIFYKEISLFGTDNDGVYFKNNSTDTSSLNLIPASSKFYGRKLWLSNLKKEVTWDGSNWVDATGATV